MLSKIYYCNLNISVQKKELKFDSSSPYVGIKPISRAYRISSYNYSLFMSIGKEKVKLEKLLVSVASVKTIDDLNMEIINEGYREYAAIIKTLYTKQPNIFGNLYNYNLREIKEHKKFTKESYTAKAKQTNFTLYRDSIVEAIESTMEYITSYVQ